MLIRPDAVLIKVCLEDLKVLAEIPNLGPVTLHVGEVAR